MAHQISITANGVAEYASTQEEWHTLGQRVARGASVEEWQTQSHLDYEIERAFVRYATGRNQDSEQWGKDESNIVLFRSDTGAALGIVSPSYKVVQPKEVLEFFREWADQGGVTIESAGVLFGGKRYFATAKLGEAVDVGGNDKVMPYALMSTSADGTLATEIRWTTVRVVCNNTLSMALGDQVAHKTSHRTKFNMASARATVEAANEQFGAFMEAARMMANIKVNMAQAQDMTKKLLEIEDSTRYSAPLERILQLFKGAGAGSKLESANGTAWGYINAITDYVDHESRAKSEEHRMVKSLWGAGDDLKQKALTLLLQG